MPSPSAPAPAAVVRPFPELDVEAERLEPTVRGLLGYLLHEPWDSPDVDDACHEVFRRALEGRDRWRKTEPLKPWLLGIARHVALDLMRSRRRALGRAAARGPAAGPVTEQLLESLADPAPGPDQRLLLAEQGVRIRRAMDALPATERRALLLFHAEGLDYRAIADRLGVPLGTVCTWILRARRRLARELAERESMS